MSIVKCPECQTDISDSAESCPKCGYPYKSNEAQYQKAVSLMPQCKNADEMRGVAALFEEISIHKDAQEKANECIMRASELPRKEEPASSSIHGDAPVYQTSAKAHKSNKRLIGNILCVLAAALFLCAALRDNPRKINAVSKEIEEYRQDFMDSYHAGNSSSSFSALYHYNDALDSIDRLNEATAKKKYMIGEGCILCGAGVVCGIAGGIMIKKSKDEEGV